MSDEISKDWLFVGMAIMFLMGIIYGKGISFCAGLFMSIIILLLGIVSRLWGMKND